MDTLKNIIDFAQEHPYVFWFVWYCIGMFTWAVGLSLSPDRKPGESAVGELIAMLIIATFWPAFLPIVLFAIVRKGLS